MKVVQKKLCVFIHYSNKANIPKYVSIYLDELSRLYDQVILVTNQRCIKQDYNNSKQNVSTILVKNEGYDLGMFYKVFQTINPLEYQQIACVNDSNILFNSLLPVFTWSKSTEYDFWGLIDSYEKPWFSTHQNNYHIQSHFIVFNSKAIAKLPAFFETLNIQGIYDEKDTEKLRQKVINLWEIGLTQFLIRQDLSIGSYIDSRSFSDLYLSGKLSNVGHKLYPELIRSGFPLIKKKVILKGSWRDVFRFSTHWKSMIRQYGNKNWEIEQLIDELIQIKSESGDRSMNKLKRSLGNLNLLQRKKIA